MSAGVARTVPKDECAESVVRGLRPHAVPAVIMKNLRMAFGRKTMIPRHWLWLPTCIGRAVPTQAQEK
jgi:hypothetical protein